MKKALPAKDIDGYLKALPAPQRKVLQKLRADIKSAAAGATEHISYRMPMFKLEGKQLVAMAAHTNHVSLYVMSPDVLRAHAEVLERYDTGEGTIRFSAARPLPTSLVKRLVRARVKELGLGQRR